MNRCGQLDAFMAGVLLLPDSAAPGRAFLDRAYGVITEVLHERRRVLSVVFAYSDPGRCHQARRTGRPIQQERRGHGAHTQERSSIVL